MAEGWRDDWRRTGAATKVVLVVIASLFVAWAAFATWLWIAF